MSPELLHAVLTANQQALEQLRQELTDLRTEHEDLKRRYEFAINRIDEQVGLSTGSARGQRQRLETSFRPGARCV